MRTTLGICLLSLTFASVPTTIRADGIPRVKVDAGIKARFNVRFYDPQAEAARLHPWYTYFPYEAHFQSPSPFGSQNGFFPNLPGRMVPGAWGKQQPTGSGSGTNSGSGSGNEGNATNSSTSGYRPSHSMSYQYSQVPSYWYGR